MTEGINSTVNKRYTEQAPHVNENVIIVIIFSCINFKDSLSHRCAVMDLVTRGELT